MKWSDFTNKQRIMLITPIALTLVMLGAFKGLVALLGFPLGYLAAFGIYWVGWCLVLPLYVLGGPGGLINLFREGSPRFGARPWKTLVLLWWPVIFPVAFIFIPRIADATASIVLASVALGVIIGVTEEVLWRGVYVRVFPNNFWLGYIYPAIGFGIWHIAPQAVRPSPMPGGVYSFVFFSVILGLSWGYYAWKTRSIRWSTIAHIINDSFGLGAFVYVTWLQ